MRKTALASNKYTRKPKLTGARAKPFISPTGGWDAVSNLASMPPDRAVQLTNFVPRPGWVEPRKGFMLHCGNLGTATTHVETVAAYNSFLPGGNKIFAAAGTVIYDVTTAGAGVSSVTGLSNARFQHKVFSNASGVQYLIMVNGADTPQLFNGTAWSTPAYTGTGVNPSSFIHVNAHKGRLWFVQKDSTAPVYLDTVGAISGAGHTFELGSLMTRGGYLMAIGTWTVDTKQTVDEYIVFITSRGQAIVYEGTDPSTANTWTLVGVYDIGPPIGRRCYLRISGDLFIITIDGVQGMSEMLSTDRAAANRGSITGTILNAMNNAAKLYKDNWGWQFVEYAKGTLAIMNIPVSENSEQIQYVMNTLTGAWCDFTGIDANCWEIDVNDNVYFGGNDGTVYRWDTGSLDYINTISCTLRTAFLTFGNPAQLKRWTMLQPLLISDQSVSPSIGLNVDFRNDAFLSTASVVVPATTNWDNFNWNEANWAAAADSSPNWISVTGLGHYASVKMQVNTGQSNAMAQWGIATWGSGQWTTLSTNSITMQVNGWNSTYETGGFV